MDRRAFIEKIIAALTLGGIFLISGCQREQAKPETLGNEEKLWKMAAGQTPSEAPLELEYAKDTPAFYRDASLGREDPNFKPKIGGG
jgi:hypothetical protein